MRVLKMLCLQYLEHLGRRYSSVQKLLCPHVGEDARKLESLYTTGENVKWYSH